MKVSGCMITKNEAEFLDASIASFIDYVDELIVVDDQSTDGTREILVDWKKKTGKVDIYSGVYNGNKMRQRNVYLQSATGDWIFCPDGDEVYTEPQMRQLSEYWHAQDQDYIFLGFRLLNFWKDFRHVIHGPMWDGVMCRTYKNLPGVWHYDTHHTVSLKPGVILAKWAKMNDQYVQFHNFHVPHYSYCKKATQIMSKIEYYMMRDNPNANTFVDPVRAEKLGESTIQQWARLHPYWSEDYAHQRYGPTGLNCCGSHNGRHDYVEKYIGEHPESIKKHRLWPRLGEYVLGMNDYMEKHWQFHNHLDHQRHQRRILFAGGKCAGRVLEVGCANGYSTNLMQCEYGRQGMSFSGAEPTDHGFSQARLKYPYIDFWKAYGENLPFPDGTFDTVLLPEIIEHCQDPRALADEAWRVCRKRMVITHPMNKRGMLADPTHLRYFTKPMMEAFCLRYGKVDFYALDDKGNDIGYQTDYAYEINGYFGISVIEKGSGK